VGEPKVLTDRVGPRSVLLLARLQEEADMASVRVDTGIAPAPGRSPVSTMPPTAERDLETASTTSTVETAPFCRVRGVDVRVISPPVAGPEEARSPEPVSRVETKPDYALLRTVVSIFLGLALVGALVAGGSLAFHHYASTNSNPHNLPVSSPGFVEARHRIAGWADYIVAHGNAGVTTWAGEVGTASPVHQIPIDGANAFQGAQQAGDSVTQAAKVAVGEMDTEIALVPVWFDWRSVPAPPSG